MAPFHSSGAFLRPQAVRFSATTVALKSIKVSSKQLTTIKLFFIAKSRRMLKIRRPRLIRI